MKTSVFRKVYSQSTRKNVVNDLRTTYYWFRDPNNEKRNEGRFWMAITSLPLLKTIGNSAVIIRNPFLITIRKLETGRIRGEVNTQIRWFFDCTNASFYNREQFLKCTRQVIKILPHITQSLYKVNHGTMEQGLGPRGQWYRKHQFYF